MTTMRILVIGGIQFMGREIVRRLAGRGHDVSVLHRRDHHDLGPAVRNLQADRSDLAAVERVLGEHAFDAVFDMAYDWQKGTPAGQVEATARACGSRLQRYVFMSSTAAYGGGLDRREDDPLAPDDVPNPYVQHKAMAERALFRLHAEAGLPVQTAGGQLFAGNLYFGEYLDLPPMTQVVAKVTRVLGVAPIAFEDGLRRSYEWYRAQPRRPIDYAFEDRLLAGRSHR